MAGRPPAHKPVQVIPIPDHLKEVEEWTVWVPYFHRRTGKLVESRYGPYRTAAEAVDILRVFCQRWTDVGIPPAWLEPRAEAAGPAGPVVTRLSEVHREAWGRQPLVIEIEDD
jgi:hypothetical protein